MTWHTRFILTLVLAATCTVGRTWAYTKGDHVPMWKRSQFSGLVTEWNNVINKQSPRFQLDRTVHLSALKLDGEDESADAVKLYTGHALPR